MQLRRKRKMKMKMAEDEDQEEEEEEFSPSRASSNRIVPLILLGDQS